MGIRRPEGLAEEDLTRSIIGAFFHVFNELGPGFLESVYVAGLTKVLRGRGHRVDREHQVRIWFEGEAIALQRIDVMVDRKVIVEVKAGDFLALTARRQLHNYLRATGIEVGLLLHFGQRPAFFREYHQKDPSCPRPVPDLPSDPN